MNSHAFDSLIAIEPHTSKPAHELPEAPQRALPKPHHSTSHEVDPQTPAIELVRLDGPSIPGKATSSGAEIQTPGDLERSRPVTPLIEDEAVNAMQSFSNPPMNRPRMLTVCLLSFAGGLTDSAPGALIPYIEKYYSIGYAVVSLIFVTNAIGFISAALIVDPLRARFGRGKSLIISQANIACGYILLVCEPPFPVVVVAFFFLGFGLAVNLSLGNVFAANLRNGTAMLGAMHGAYGIGGTVGPLIATGMVTGGNLSWSRYYLLPLGVTAFNLFFSAWSFWNYEKESNQTLSDETTRSESTKLKTHVKALVKSFSSKAVILGALFIFAYQGAEVSISGWVVSFLIAARKGNPAAVGYVTSGFWGGITLGRFLLSHVGHKIGEKRFVYGMTIGAAVFELLVWFVPNVVGDAVALAIVGLLLGPVYPCSAHVFSTLIPRKDQVSGLGIISAFGSSGGAVAPFTTGILAQATGTFVMHPIAVGLFAVMIACWFGLPTIRKRDD